MPAPESNVPRHQTTYPETRKVSDHWLLCKARDAETKGDIEGGFEQDVAEAMRQLEDAGLVQFLETKRVVETYQD